MTNTPAGNAGTTATTVTTVTREATGTAVLAATIALAAAGWAGAFWIMRGMGMGPATKLGSLPFFVISWLVMTGAMMLPGAAPAVAGRAGAGGARAAGGFAGCYLAVWAVAGVAVYAAYRPHGTVAAGLVVIAAGCYELTPVKRRLRRGCRDGAVRGLGFGLRCLGSSAGLMAVLAAVGVMSIGWMAVIAVVVTAQKLLPVLAAIDVPVALAMIGLGAWILLAPGSVPGLIAPM